MKGLIAFLMVISIACSAYAGSGCGSASDQLTETAGDTSAFDGGSGSTINTSVEE